MHEILQLINEMSPYLLLGFLIAGLMHAFVPGGLYSKYLSGNNFRSVLYAALFGVPLPLCSCGVIPTAMSLRKEGASRGATTSFLIATPQTGVDSIFATYSLLGLPFAILRPVVALVTSVFGGVLVNKFVPETAEDRVKQAAHAAKLAGEGEACAVQPTKKNFFARLGSALRYGFVDMVRDIGQWLIIGLVIAGLITIFVPNDFFTRFADVPLLSYIVVLLIAIPMYVCATGSIPVAAALMLKGLSPGAALVLLMAGPASNVASILVINRVLGRRTLIIYLTALVSGALVFGLGVDYLLPREWFMGFSAPMDACCHIETPWFQWASTILMALLLLYAFVVRPLVHKLQGTPSLTKAESDHPHTEVMEEEAVAEQERVFAVEGMTCNHCRNHVEKALLSTPGVVAARVSLENKEARVVGTATDEALQQAVEEIGYQLKKK